MMKLIEALRADDQLRLAIVGAGGKTTALFQLARQYQKPILLSTTTHLSVDQAALADQWIVAKSPADILEYSKRPISGVTLFTGPEIGGGRVSGLDAAALEAVRDLAGRHNCALLIEADGSKRMPIKAPAEHEPAVPAWVNCVLVVVGMSAYGKAVQDGTVFRIEQFSAVTGCELGDPITPEVIENLLCHPQGGLKNIPASARKVALLNQADTGELQSVSGKIAERLLRAYDAVIVSSLATESIHAAYEPTAGIILAAGASSRYGSPKLLLPWRGKPIIFHVASTALVSGLSPVVVVCGRYEQEVRQALAGLPVQIITNPHWEEGQSTSIKAGLSVLPGKTGSTFFMLGDQPQIPVELLSGMIASHNQSRAAITAPMVGDRRANPALFDRVTFDQLNSLQGDIGGRAIFKNFSVNWYPWMDANILFDVDTPEDYQKLQELE